ncbi:MAG: hypothetical protein RLY58_1025 [Pseudomonadota bacterium]|jgi:adenosylcobinamide-phosphate synthase
MISTFWIAWGVAWGLEWCISEPRRYHPLVGFGRCAAALEQRLNTQSQATMFWCGAFAWALMVLCSVAVFALAKQLVPTVTGFIDGVALWIALGAVSLYRHVQAVVIPLQQHDIVSARQALAQIVSRDCQQLDVTAVCAATVETTLENGADAIFASVFWFVLGSCYGIGAECVILHRAANTLDAMWGYRTPRFEWFGKTAARVDDLLNYVPARLTALTYLLLGHSRLAWHCWRQQARQHDSPNAGVVMAAGAGALQVQVGGAACYAGVWHKRPVLGQGVPADCHHIMAALHLLQRSLGLWIIVITGGWLWFKY